jgi:hypothetical protein
MRTAVVSKLIAFVEYNKKSGLLRLNLTDGQIREFDSVPEEVVRGLALAESPGQYYVEMIRGKFIRR